jgi:hypothetical protein
MKEIQKKIQELLNVSNEEVDYKKGWEESRKKIFRQDQLMNEIKVLAKANKTLLGRTIRFPHADSYAVYIITKVNKKTVRLTWVNYCDGWQDDRCGLEANMDIRYATQKVQGEDNLDKIFSSRNQ